eukprot:scaffold121957_cov28-Tisochrysis_lutea.AAC.8
MEFAGRSKWCACCSHGIVKGAIDSSHPGRQQWCRCSDVPCSPALRLTLASSRTLERRRHSSAAPEGCPVMCAISRNTAVAWSRRNVSPGASDSFTVSMAAVA